MGESLAYFVGGAILGLVVGVLSRRFLVFKNEVEVGDVLNLLSAFLIALVLGNAIQKRVGNRRVEKDLLIARITATDKALVETHALFMRRVRDVGSVEDSLMFDAFKELSNHLFLLEKALTKTRMITINLKPLKSARHEYRKRVLGDDFSPGPYSPETINHEERIYRKFATQLMSLTFEVNHQ